MQADPPVSSPAQQAPSALNNNMIEPLSNVVINGYKLQAAALQWGGKSRIKIDVEAANVTVDGLQAEEGCRGRVLCVRGTGRTQVYRWSTPLPSPSNFSSTPAPVHHVSVAQLHLQTLTE